MGEDGVLAEYLHLFLGEIEYKSTAFYYIIYRIFDSLERIRANPDPSHGGHKK